MDKLSISSKKRKELLKNVFSATSITETALNEIYTSEHNIYIVKRVIKNDEVDYSTMERRRQACMRDYEINSKFTSLYDGIYKVVSGGDKYFIANIDSPYPVIEYIIKMKPFNNTLRGMIDLGSMDRSYIEGVAIQLSSMYRSIKGIAFKAIEYSGAKPMSERFNKSINLLTDANEVVNSTCLSYIHSKTITFIRENTDIIRDRIDSGFIKGFHGNLVLSNMVIVNRRLELINAVYENDYNRYRDTLYDFASLAFELEALGLLDLSDAFLQEYSKEYPDKTYVRLINFYKSLVALENSVLLVDKLAEVIEWSDEYLEVRAKLDKSIYKAVNYTFNIDNKKCVIITGYMGSNKTIISKALARRLGSKYLSLEDLRAGNKLRGTDMSESMQYGKGIYNDETSLKIHYQLGCMVREYLSTGGSVIVDAALIKQEYYEELLRGMMSKPIVVKIDADISELKHNLALAEQNTTTSMSSIPQSHKGLLDEHIAEYTFNNEDFSVELNPIVSKMVDTIIQKVIIENDRYTFLN